MNKSFNTLIESILEAGYKSPASINENDWDDSTERYFDRSPVEVDKNLNNFRDYRQDKKDKVISNKEKLIKKHQDQLNNWLERMSSNYNISTIAIETQRIKYQHKINKEIQELERIKKLPLTDQLFN